jgi:hypothetical protein
MTDPVVTVSMAVSEWEAVLSVEPMGQETYTDDGIRLFNAFQQIHQAVDQVTGGSQ